MVAGSGPAGKQRNIASFFGKPSGAASARNSAPAAAAGKGKSEVVEGVAVNAQAEAGSTAAAKPECNGAVSGDTLKRPKLFLESVPAALSKKTDAPMKRLRKAGAASPAKRSAAAAELDDNLAYTAKPTEAPTDPLPGSPAQQSPVKSVPTADAGVPEEQAPAPSEQPAVSKPAAKAAPKKRKTAPQPAAEADMQPAASGNSDGEAKSAASDDEGASSPRKKAPKPTKKAILKYADPKSKVEGVGLGSIAAAAKHKDVDVQKLITWKRDEPVPFSVLAQAWEEVADISGRLAIQNLMCNTLRAIYASNPEDLLPTMYLCTSCVAPAHAGIELGVGDAILVKALAEATGRSEKQVNKEYDEEGDLGIVAATARAKQKSMFKPKPLSISGVHKAFLEIASTKGNKSQDKKRSMIIKLLAAATSSEAGYIMRALQGKLRIGLGEQAVLNALAWASLLHREDATAAAPEPVVGSPSKGKAKAEGELSGRLEEAAAAVKLAFSQCPSFDVLIPALLEHGAMGVEKVVCFQPGVPVKPMLAKPMTGVSEVLDKFEGKPFTCEYKYDGERAQVHVLSDGAVHIYSRNSEDNTGKYPDIVANIPKLLQSSVTGGVVLDCEAVAYDREKGIILPFQVLSTRARKGVKIEDIKIQVCLYAFDCLYLNGEALTQKPLTERRAALYSALSEKEGELMWASTKESSDVEELTLFLTDSVTAGTEGLIVKSLDSTYEPSKRSSHWLKLKKDYMDSVGDTFDVVPIGAWHGKGKRKGVYGAYLLAIYNEETEQFQSISKIGTGFSEQLLIDLSASLAPTIIPGPRPYYQVGNTTMDVPDVWFDNTQVWEVKAADLSISPRHMAAFGMHTDGKGISIRFPRLVRVRDDKIPEQATSAEQVVEMYSAQAIVGQGNKPAATDDDY